MPCGDPVAAASRPSSDANATAPIPVPAEPKSWRRVTRQAFSRCRLFMDADRLKPVLLTCEGFIEIENRQADARERGELGHVERFVARALADAQKVLGSLGVGPVDGQLTPMHDKATPLL